MALHIGLSVLALLTLLVGVTWRNQILFSPTSQGPQLQLKWFASLIAVPLVALVSQGVFSGEDESANGIGYPCCALS